MKREYIIPPSCGGMTVRDYVRGTLELSASCFKKAKYSGGILLDGTPVTARHILEAGSVLTIVIPDTASDGIVSADLPINVLYEDEDILAVDKKAGMPVHPSVRHYDDTLANAVMYYYRKRGVPFTFRVLTRLDIDTTGVVLIAKNAAAAGKFAACSPEKTYFAVTVGCPTPKAGEINAPIARDEGIMKRKIDASGKPSLTRYETLCTENGLSLVRCTPVTGRTHQIRVHLSHIDCPLYGDYLYGTEIPSERTRLHCSCVSFVHPMTGKDMRIVSPLPDDCAKLFTDTELLNNMCQ